MLFLRPPVFVSLQIYIVGLVLSASRDVPSQREPRGNFEASLKNVWRIIVVLFVAQSRLDKCVCVCVCCFF